jgi:RecB family exonuclease
MLGDIDNYWTRFSARGLSPTALETYARCPFQFFARHVLGLEPLDRPEEILGPSPAEFGELGHEILNRFYRTLIDSGYFNGRASATKHRDDFCSTSRPTLSPTTKGKIRSAIRWHGRA